MNHQQNRIQPQSLRKQQGIATILIVILVGAALTATSFGIMHSMRSTQAKQTAVHAITHAQTGLWSGVEAFRRYLGAIGGDVAALDALNNTTDVGIDLGAAYGRITANNITVTTVGGRRRVAAEIVSVHPIARSSAAVGVVFEVDPDACLNCINLSSSLDFYDSLTATGEVGFVLLTSASTPPINVDGDITMLSISDSTNLKVLNATGSVALSSGIKLDSVHSNVGVDLSGSAYVRDVTSGGYARTSSGGGAGYIYANGLVDLGGSSSDANKPTYDVYSLSTVEVKAGYYDLVQAAGVVTLNSTVSKIADRVESTDNVVISGNTGVDTIISEKQLICNALGWSNFTSIATNGDLDSSCVYLAPQNVLTEGLAVNQNNTVARMAPVPEFEMPGLVVNVWALKNEANYIFEYDSVARKPIVTVQNVNGADPAATYYIGNYSTAHKSYLCTEVTNKGNCVTPTDPGMTVCLGYSDWDECISYDATKKTWTLVGQSAAPGIMWFDGNVTLNTETSYISVLATGDVITNGEYRGKSVNFAGYDEVCLAQGTNVDSPDIFRARFETQHPTNLCDKNAGEYKPNPAGNIAIAAGGKDPNNNYAYTGGNIDVATNTMLWGSVLAGNVLTTGGQNTIHGYVTAAAQVTKGSGNNELGGSTTIDLTNFPSTYNPTLIPNMDPCVAGCAPENFARRSRLLWSRYL